MRTAPPLADRGISPGLQANAAERSFLAAGTPANIRAAGDFIRAPSRLWMNAIADGMLSTVVVLLSLTAIEPVMHWAARLSSRRSRSMIRGRNAASAVDRDYRFGDRQRPRQIVGQWGLVRTYFADTTPPRKP